MTMRFIALSGVAGAAMLSACASPEPQKADVVGTPNPASAYCVEQGGKLEIRKETGGQVGYCHLPDGRVVEEWELFRASRQPG